MDLSKLSVKELQELQEQAEQLTAEKREGELQTLRNSITDQINASPFTFDEVMVKPAKPKAKIKPKYQDPSNPDNTWTGRGRKPKWVEEYLKTGKNLNDVLIDKPAPAKQPAKPEDEL